jgi:hypothetical protein
MAAGRTAEPPPELPGRVVDRDAQPVPGALLVIVESTVPMPEIAIQSDEDGRFALRLPEGGFTLRGHSPDGRVGEATVAVPGDSEIVVVVEG